MPSMNEKYVEDECNTKIITDKRSHSYSRKMIKVHYFSYFMFLALLLVEDLLRSCRGFCQGQCHWN